MVKFETTPGGMARITLSKEEEEANGEIVIEEGAYGFYVSSPTLPAPVALLDLFREFKIVLYDPKDEDRMARVTFDEKGMEIEWE